MAGNKPWKKHSRCNYSSFLWLKGIVCHEGSNFKVPLHISAIAHQQFLSASAAGLGRQDDAAVVKVINSCIQTRGLNEALEVVHVWHTLTFFVEQCVI
ncbi:hypothetical protein QJS10_CPA01g02220 [Acorus calamus]|uniref:Uncharacterized protein n=1 Tax=Acorus calamus TaxID=4465 RepID=A0AAV9FHF1_ACOCL|nr:hypothetical protein QJS10_CPA01g02220 [Acorus calamus]